jgi:hypothetical protein
VRYINVEGVDELVSRGCNIELREVTGGILRRLELMVITIGRVIVRKRLRIVRDNCLIFRRRC